MMGKGWAIDFRFSINLFLLGDRVSEKLDFPGELQDRGDRSSLHSTALLSLLARFELVN